MDHDTRVRESASFALSSPDHVHTTHRSSETDTDGLDIAFDQLHGVKNRHTRVDFSTGRVDIHGDVFVRVFFLQVEHLRDDIVDHVSFDSSADEDDAIFEESGVYVIGAFAVVFFFDDGGNEDHS